MSLIKRRELITVKANVRARLFFKSGAFSHQVCLCTVKRQTFAAAKFSVLANWTS